MPFIYAKTHQSNFKSLPSLQFINKIIDVCQRNKESDTPNFYDKKNHILFINDAQLFSKMLFQKYKRTMLSFEKQLKMLGFKKRKNFNESSQEKNKNEINPNYQKSQKKANKSNLCVQNSQSQQKFIYVWKSNKNKLLQHQLQQFEDHLSEQISKALELKEKLQFQSKQIDSQLQNVLFSSFIYESLQENTVQQMYKSCGQANGSEKITENIFNLKENNNKFQDQQKILVKELSGELNKQLQLYRLLIYKDNHSKNRK